MLMHMPKDVNIYWNSFYSRCHTCRELNVSLEVNLSVVYLDNVFLDIHFHRSIGSHLQGLCKHHSHTGCLYIHWCFLKHKSNISMIYATRRQSVTMFVLSKQPMSNKLRENKYRGQPYTISSTWTCLYLYIYICLN